MQSVTILGSTGSIGQQALGVIRKYPSFFSVFALTAHSDVDTLFHQCREFHPVYAVMVNAVCAKQLSERLDQALIKVQVLSGQASLSEIASFEAVDIVLSAITGASALLPTLSAITAGKRVLLANKESLVMAGELVMSAVKQHNATLLPIDSEHNAILQCLPASFLPGQSRPDGVSSIVLTASGGPFVSMSLDKLAWVSPEDAIAHPNWSMGAKISVDSATMMNKGLEVIEARWIFDFNFEDIDVLIHPQSYFHAFVRYQDGNVLSCVAPPDMRIPIAYGLGWPQRLSLQEAPMNLLDLSKTSFYPPDTQRYPCLALAYAALKAGGTAGAILNAANEVAVDLFLSRKLSFNNIAILVEETLNQISICSSYDLDSILAIDQASRRCAMEVAASRYAMEPLETQV